MPQECYEDSPFGMTRHKTEDGSLLFSLRVRQRTVSYLMRTVPNL